MAILKIKDETGKFVDIPAIQGAPGKDGAIQYEAGENITIDGNVISASGGITLNDVKAITGELENLSTEDKSSLVNAINEAMNNGGITELTGDIVMQNLSAGIYLLNGNCTLFYQTGQIAERFIFAYPEREKEILFVTKSSYGNASLSYCILFVGNYIKIYDCIFYKTYSYLYSNILTMNNTTSYTPTSDYNPTTKKYVDDSIKAAITTTLEGGY